MLCKKFKNLFGTFFKQFFQRGGDGGVTFFCQIGTHLMHYYCTVNL